VRFRRPRLEIPIRRISSDAVPGRGSREKRSKESERRISEGRFRGWFLRVVIAVVFLSGIGAALFGERGAWDLRQSREEHRVLERQVRASEARVRDLSRQIARLNDDPSTWERLAREELGYARKNEVLFVLPPAPESDEDRPSD
jgi:cell division protein FtsB